MKKDLNEGKERNLFSYDIMSWNGMHGIIHDINFSIHFHLVLMIVPDDAGKMSWALSSFSSFLPSHIFSWGWFYWSIDSFLPLNVCLPHKHVLLLLMLATTTDFSYHQRTFSIITISFSSLSHGISDNFERKKGVFSSGWHSLLLIIIFLSSTVPTSLFSIDSCGYCPQHHHHHHHHNIIWSSHISSCWILRCIL